MTQPSNPTPTSDKPIIDPSALRATVVRYAVPTLVGVLVSLATKAGFNLSPTDAFGIVAPLVGTAYSALAHFLEAKVPALKYVLGATKPSKLTK